jgi:hypothetical protein
MLLVGAVPSFRLLPLKRKPLLHFADKRRNSTAPNSFKDFLKVALLAQLSHKYISMLPDYYIKVKSWIGDNQKDLYIASVIFLVSIASFGLGRLSVLWPEKQPITIENQSFDNAQDGEAEIIKQKEAATVGKTIPNSKFLIPDSHDKYVASKNGTAYHYPWCPGALKIKEENKIWFGSKEEAESKGYKSAGNCEGL